MKSEHERVGVGLGYKDVEACREYQDYSTHALLVVLNVGILGGDFTNGGNLKDISAWLLANKLPIFSTIPYSRGQTLQAQRLYLALFDPNRTLDTNLYFRARPLRTGKFI